MITATLWELYRALFSYPFISARSCLPVLSNLTSFSRVQELLPRFRILAYVALPHRSDAAGVQLRVCGDGWMQPAGLEPAMTGSSVQRLPSLAMVANFESGARRGICGDARSFARPSGCFSVLLAQPIQSLTLPYR